MARINGRSLARALEVTGEAHDGEVRVTEWASVCPSCDAKKLGFETGHPWPFQCADDAMRTVADYVPGASGRTAPILTFAGLRFTRSAMHSSLEILKKEDKTTGEVEACGQKYLAKPSPRSAYEFSERVCTWGRGQRVWANLNRHNTEANLARQLNGWLSEVPGARTPGGAIGGGTQIKGLGVSFASKHLRLLMPDSYGVLDEVISVGLGFALNLAGFGLFTAHLRAFQAQHATGLSLAQIESALFLMVRQGVRSVD